MKKELEFQGLEQFVAVARMRNFTKAATALNLSQPALSRAIQKLEDQFGQPLFERKPREVVLTDLGELLMVRAQEILKLVEDTFTELSEAGRHGRIRLGAIPTIAPYFLPRVLDAFAKAHPEIQVVVQEDTTEAMLKRCSYGEIDLAVIALPIVAKYLEVEPLFSEELFLVVPQGHSLESAEAITPESLEGYPFIVLNEAHCLAENIASFCRRVSIHPVTIERTSQLATIQELVALNHGISLIPEMARLLDPSQRRIYRSFDGDKPQRTIAMIWNAYRYQSSSAKALMAFLRTQSPDSQVTGEPGPAWP